MQVTTFPFKQVQGIWTRQYYLGKEQSVQLKNAILIVKLLKLNPTSAVWYLHSLTSISSSIRLFDLHCRLLLLCPRIIMAKRSCCIPAIPRTLNDSALPPIPLLTNRYRSSCFVTKITCNRQTIDRRVMQDWLVACVFSCIGLPMPPVPLRVADKTHGRHVRNKQAAIFEENPSQICLMGTSYLLLDFAS